MWYGYPMRDISHWWNSLGHSCFSSYSDEVQPEHYLFSSTQGANTSVLSILPVALKKKKNYLFFALHGEANGFLWCSPVRSANATQSISDQKNTQGWGELLGCPRCETAVMLFFHDSGPEHLIPFVHFLHSGVPVLFFETSEQPMGRLSKAVPRSCSSSRFSSQLIPSSFATDLVLLSASTHSFHKKQKCSP